MASYNRVIVMGNLTKDPYVKRFGRDNTKVAYLRLAINERRRTRSGEMVDTPVFVDVNAYEKLAELCEKFCHKGKNMLVEGRLQMETRTNPDGHTSQRLFIRAQSVKFLSSPNWQGEHDKGGRDDREGVPSQEPDESQQDGDEYSPEEGDETQNRW